MSYKYIQPYVPYGRQFRDKDVFIPYQKGYRLNISGMIDRNNRYEGVSTNENITAGKAADFPDRLSLSIKKIRYIKTP